MSVLSFLFFSRQFHGRRRVELAPDHTFEPKKNAPLSCCIIGRIVAEPLVMNNITKNCKPGSAWHEFSWIFSMFSCEYCSAGPLQKVRLMLQSLAAGGYWRLCHVVSFFLSQPSLRGKDTKGKLFVLFPVCLSTSVKTCLLMTLTSCNFGTKLKLNLIHSGC